MEPSLLCWPITDHESLAVSGSRIESIVGRLLYAYLVLTLRENKNCITILLAAVFVEYSLTLLQYYTLM